MKKLLYSLALFSSVSAFTDPLKWPICPTIDGPVNKLTNLITEKITEGGADLVASGFFSTSLCQDQVTLNTEDKWKSILSKADQSPLQRKGAFVRLKVAKEIAAIILSQVKDLDPNEVTSIVESFLKEDESFAFRDTKNPLTLVFARRKEVSTPKNEKINFAWELSFRK
ncbi:MAG: hypothetical protein A4S09_04315 [Proteobacteria bacterium SG_bin7]|nr:MAG: hypothetical protein A4S09_04315 [Proteobacteria bacterium SG_bin7]